MADFVRWLGVATVRAREVMRSEFLAHRLQSGANVWADIVQLPGANGWTDGPRELHLTYRPKKKGATVVEAIDVRRLAIDWALMIEHDTEFPTRVVSGIVARPTSCQCGGSEAWLAQTLIHGQPAGEIMLGCTCHTTAEQLIDRLRQHVWER